LPILERNFERAWSFPIWENDGAVVAEVFCVVMIVMAINCQLVNEEGLYRHGSGSEDVSQERYRVLSLPIMTVLIIEIRHGSKFSELSRKYLNFNNPVCSLEDATGMQSVKICGAIL
jgi:hypothetical protein